MAINRIVTEATGAERVRRDASEDHATATAPIFGALHRRGAAWTFRAVGQDHAGGLAGMVRHVGPSAA